MKKRKKILVRSDVIKIVFVGAVMIFASIVNSVGYKSDFRIMAGYWQVAQSPATTYSGSGSCAVNGSGTCYKLTNSSNTYRTSGLTCNAACGTISAFQSYSTCTWNPQLYSYARSGAPGTGYNFSGATACDVNGTGNCYAPGTNFSTWYCGDGACGSGGCTTCSASYLTSTACTYSNGSDQDTVTLTEGANNLSQSKSITFWVYSTNRTGSFIQFQMGEIAANELTFNFSINALNTWEQKTWDISAIASASKDAITKFAFKNTDPATDSTFYFDDIQALAFAPNDPSACLIKESATDTSLIPFWTDNADNENGYQLEKKINSGAFTVLTNLGVNATGYQDNSISQNNTYTYRVRSYKLGLGSTDFSGYCEFPILDLHSGSFKFNGLKLNGLKVN